MAEQTRVIRCTQDQYDWIIANRRGKRLPAIKQVKADADLSKLKSERDDFKRRLDQAVKVVAELEANLGKISEFSTRFKSAQAKEFRVNAKGQRREAIAVASWGDWHIEETVDPRKVEFRNEFNTTIARDRVQSLLAQMSEHVTMCHRFYSMDTLVLNLIGDFISGYIHEELEEGNALSPIEATLLAFELLSGAIQTVLNEYGFKKILIVCKPGNHGRTTKKPRVSTGAENSFEWLMYQFLAKHFKDEKRISFQIGRGYHDYVSVYDTTVRIHHGEAIKYSGGVGGLTIPLNKAIAQWNTYRHADLDVMGHWHQSLFAKRHVVGGSLIGWNAYAVYIKAQFELASQPYFLIEPGKGKTLEIPIHLQTNYSEAA